VTALPPVESAEFRQRSHGPTPMDWMQHTQLWPQENVGFENVTEAEIQALPLVQSIENQAATEELPPRKPDDFALASSELQPTASLEEKPSAPFFSSAAVVARRMLARILAPGASWSLGFGSGVFRFASSVLLGLWLLTAGARVSLLFWRLIQIRKLKGRTEAPEVRINERFLHVCKEVGVRRKVRLKTSRMHRSAVLLGFFHPVILLPEETARSSDGTQVEHILRHELAHVSRWDDWANLLQHITRALLFFHPAVWWICRQLCLQREIACDDYVLQQGGRPRAYALLLADLASERNRGQLLLAPGVLTNKSQLQQRIDMILKARRNMSPGLAKTRFGFIASAAALAAVATLYCAPRLVLAQQAVPVPVPPTTPKAPTPAIPGAPAVAAIPPHDADLVEVAPPAAVAPASADSAPRFKDSVGLPPGSALIAPVAPVAPVTPVPPRPAITRGPVVIATGPRPHDGPRAQRSPDMHHGGSIEERLTRLEEMVQSLMAERHGKYDGGHMLLKKGPGHELMIDQKELERIQRFAEREAQRANEETKRALKQFEKARKEQEVRREKRDLGKQKEAWGKQIETLRKQRQELERQMEKLEQQIEKIEQEQEQQEQAQNQEQEEQEHKDAQPEQAEPKEPEANQPDDGEPAAERQACGAKC